MSSYHYSFYSPTDCTAWVFSHRFHRFTQKLGCLQGGALVSSAPTKQNRYSPTESTEPTELLAECIPPQIAQIYTEVRLPSRGCTCLRSALPLARARSAPTKQEVHQPSKIDILPRNPQNPQNFLLRIFSHGFHRFTQIVWLPSRECTCLKCTNQARSAPTKQNRYSPTESTEPTELLAECILPQISQINTDG